MLAAFANPRYEGGLSTALIRVCGEVALTTMVAQDSQRMQRVEAEVSGQERLRCRGSYNAWSG